MLLCQNAEFAPIHGAWRDTDGSPASGQRQVFAPELVNAAPPFGVRGGVQDVLTASGGDVLLADGYSAKLAAAMFEDCEGVDIEPAAAVAVACLKAAVGDAVRPDSRVLLNITGGGRQRARAHLGPGPHAGTILVTRETAPESVAAEILSG
jgi:cysteate synthase